QRGFCRQDAGGTFFDHEIYEIHEKPETAELPDNMCPISGKVRISPRGQLLRVGYALRKSQDRYQYEGSRKFYGSGIAA
ncbi:MAG: hypothetical protein ACLFUS_14865, partial [Candidatus Sumerlaeia bacterium]